MKTFWRSFFNTRDTTFMQFKNHDQCKLHLDDVVQTEIKGKDIKNTLKRFWYNLILVNFDNPEAKMFFLSKFSILRERRRHYIYYKNTIHPWSYLRVWWSKLIAVCVFLNAFTITLTLSELHADHTKFLCPINICLEIIIIADILVHFAIGFVETEKKTVILDHNRIFLNYLSTTIFLHVVTALPIQMFVSAAERKLTPSIKRKYCPSQSIPCIPSIFVCFLRILSGLRIFRLFDVTDSWKLGARIYPNSYPSNWRFVHMLLICFLSINQSSNVSHAATQWVSQKNGEMDVDSLLAQYYIVKMKNHSVFFLEKSNILKTFLVTTQGYYRLFTFMDRIAIMTNYFIGIGYIIWCGLEFITRMNVQNHRKHMMLNITDEAKSYMKRRKIPSQLQDRVLEYFNYIELINIMPLRKNELYNSLPKSIKNEMKIASKRHLIKNLDIFANWPDELINKLTILLKQDVYLSGDTVVYVGTMNECLSILEHGVLMKYLPDGHEVNRVVDGEYFGELCLVTPEDKNLLEIVAATNSCVVSLEKTDFTEVVSSYPDLVKGLYTILKEQSDLSITSNKSFSNSAQINLGNL